MLRFYNTFIFIAGFVLITTNIFSQCGPGTPVIVADLTGNPSATWISPVVIRNDNCCGSTPPDRCVKFIITLDSAAVAINFDIASGAVPPGALYYQINCGPPVAVGSPICLDGPGPHILTFCKPGNNPNTYSITSIPGAASGPDIVINDGCQGSFAVTGLIDSTISWTSIFPGATGQYDSYLSCASGCSFTEVNAQPGYPPYVDYLVCGLSTAPCVTTPICDTVRVNFNPTLYVNIIPQNPTICFGATSTSFTATGSGGTPPYNYLWNTGETTATISGGVGTYSVILGDISGCPPVSTSVTVTAFANTITANAGADQTVCATNPNVTLAGSVTGVTTGAWSGGSGTYIPNNTSLNATYIPTAAELAAGSVTLTLTTTNNGTCPPDSDVVQIFYTTFTTTLNTSTTPVSCAGGSNGSATVTTSGGFPPYTYSWSTTPVQTNPTATGIPAGSYIVTLTDVNGCTGSDTAVVTEPYPLFSNTQQNNVLCNGGGTGDAFVQVFGGVLPYSYLWSPTGQSTATATNLSNGTHIVTITDGNGCIHRDTVIISQPLPLALTISQTNVSCFGGNNGTATANISGGTTPYSFAWSSGSTAQTATSLSAGTDTLVVTDNNGCIITGTVTITEPPLLVVSLNANDVTCFNLSDGSAAAVVSGGAPGYTYNWNPGTGSSVSALAPGSYTLIVSDLNSCQQSVPFTITQPVQLTLALASLSNVSCFGGADGMASVSANGGTPGYSYSWSPNVGSTATVNNLSANTYTATVTDSNNCTASVSIIITQPSAPVSATSIVTNVSCSGGSDGSITVTPAGGTSSYTILWTTNGSVSMTLSGVPAGNYPYIITDANGCTFNGSAAITEPPPITLSTTNTSTTCGLSNGSATVTASGGAGGYTYVWTPNVSSTDSATNILSGNYTIDVTDAAGCTNSTFINVNDITAASAVVTLVNNVSCYGGSDGSAQVTVTSGTPAFSYLWSPSGSTSTTPANLPAGVNTVQVTDGNGCFSYFSIIITEPDSLTLVMTSTPVSCFGGSDGTATVYASGGTPGYNYVWTPAAGSGSTGTGFSAGNVSVTVTDAEGCIKTETVTVTEPTQTFVNITGSTNVSCFGGNNGTASALATGGTPGYTYLWSPGAISGPNATGLSAGTYTVTSTDANGCTAVNSVVITQPAAPVSVSFTTTQVSCFGGTNGTATAIPAGGTPGYSYSWSAGSQITQTATGLNAGNHTVVVTDFLGCTVTGIVTVTQPPALTATIVTSSTTCGNSNGNASVQVNGGNAPYTYLWNPGAYATAVINNVTSGNYTVQVTDNTGCIANAGATILNIPGPVASISSITNVSCFGGSNGSATVSIASGTAPFQILWLPNGGSGLTANNLAAGNYSVTITDANGCQAFTNTAITQPTLLNPVISNINNVSCFGFSDGSVSASVSGGTGAYTYSWSPAGGNGSVTTLLPIGTYTLTVTDQNGCVATTAGIITQPPVLTISIVSSTNPLCFGGSNGSAQVVAGGGTPSYSYVWNTSPAQAGEVATNLSATTYIATATDAEGCIATISVTLSQPTQVIMTVSPDDTICGGQSTVVSASASGGNNPYMYIWSPNLGNNQTYTVTPPVSTVYTVTAYDNSGCASNTDSVDIQVYYLNSSNVVVAGFSPICLGSSSLVYATVTGSNTGPLTYQWNQNLGTGPGGFSVTPVVPTYYVCTVTNACGISVTDSVLIDFNPPPTVSFSSDVMSGCVPLTVNFSDLSVTNTADSIYSWYWTFGNNDTSTQSDPSYTYNLTGSYNVTLTIITYGGCTGNSAGNPYIINVFPVPSASFTVNATTFNIPVEQLICTNTSIGATMFAWTFGDGGTSSDISPSYYYTTLGDYPVQLIATNQYNCSDTAEIIVHTTSDIVFPNAFTPNTSGPNGGTYTYTDLSNDVFFPYTAGVDNFHLMIFNRWGELIFETFDINIGWDGYYRGQLCEQGVYVWKAEVLFQDERKFNKAGDVTLLR